ncbi:MAG: tetratricopeptide repeat protein [Tannerellaceae bacterium]|jgi:tetratricopeptide (TPR) repeat protein|nr:tetratricopeptide repeat protein [Tannerellaceae bacterium]
MATNKKKGTQAEAEVGEIISRSEQFIEKYSKHLMYAILGIAVVVAIIMGIRHGYLIPREDRAAVALFKGEQYFARDSFALALNGNGADFNGFVSIVEQYGNTKAGNLAKAYTGICYYRTGELDLAMKSLKSFKSRDNMISPAIVGLIGDCYVNMGQTGEGIPYFEKAANAADNNLISPAYLKKAGIAYESLGQYQNAEKAYTVIKEKYSTSVEAGDIDKYITRAKLLAK